MIRFCATFVLLTLIHYEAIESVVLDDSWESDNEKLAALSELPLERLILLKQRLKRGYRDNNSSNSKGYSMNFPFPAQNNEEEYSNKKPPLKRTYEDYGDHHHHHHHEPPSWKDTKSAKKNVQTIFQTTVTILAFLAFGGYLVCLILTTIRGNSAAAAMVIQQNQSSSTTTTTRTKRGAGFLVGEGVTVDKAVFALNLIAEGYTKYHEF